MLKPFSLDLFNDNDNAKYDVMNWLIKRGNKVWVNDDQYGIDLLGECKGEPYAWEVEIKHNWTTTVFPFSTIHYSYRKAKFINSNVNTYFVTVNHNRDRFLFIKDQDFMQGKVISKNTIYTTDESFVEIPIIKAIIVDAKV